MSPVLELPTLYDLYCTRGHQIKSKPIHGGDSSDKCDSHYMKTRQSQHIRKAKYYNSRQNIVRQIDLIHMFQLDQGGAVRIFN